LLPKHCLLAIHERLQKIVASKLTLDWSPEQISGWLKIPHPENESMRVSHERLAVKCSRSYTSSRGSKQ
jgi:IS30 family transposase